MVPDATMRQPCFPFHWILIALFETHPVNVSEVESRPLTLRCPLRWSRTTRGCFKPPAPTVKSVKLVAVPPGVTTLIFPVVAPLGTVAWIVVSESTVKVADVPLKVTLVVPVKLVPVIATDVPASPLVGVKDVMLGTAEPETVKFVALAAVPPGATTLIFPVVAPLGTVAWICVAESTMNVADVPLKVTLDAPVKPVPVIMTDVPIGPMTGRNNVTTGAGGAATVNESRLVPVPSESPTEIVPVVAPAGTVAVICTFESTENVAVVPWNATAVATLASLNPTPAMSPTCPGTADRREHPNCRRGSQGRPGVDHSDPEQRGDNHGFDHGLPSRSFDTHAETPSLDEERPDRRGSESSSPPLWAET